MFLSILRNYHLNKRNRGTLIQRWGLSSSVQGILVFGTAFQINMQKFLALPYNQSPKQCLQYLKMFLLICVFKPCICFVGVTGLKPEQVSKLVSNLQTHTLTSLRATNPSLIFTDFDLV